MVSCEGELGTGGWRIYCDSIQLEDDRAYRLNVDDPTLCKIRLDDWRPANTGETTMNEIREKTDAYLEKADMRQAIDSIARRDVHIRRERAKTERWEEFAVDLYHSCATCRRRQRYEKRAELRTHLQDSDMHRADDGGPMTDMDIEAALNEGRRYTRGSPHAR
jgi:hypothetical protein